MSDAKSNKSVSPRKRSSGAPAAKGVAPTAAARASEPTADSPAAAQAGAANQPDAMQVSDGRDGERAHGGAAAALAADLVAGTSEHNIDHYVRALGDAAEATWTQAARVLDEAVLLKPDMLSHHVDKLCAALHSEHARVAQTAANALPLLAKVVPAKVAKQLDALQAAFPSASDIAKDGLVRTFVALCIASVTYQKRVLAVFESALRDADAKTLPRWTELVLPALKGEPYAQARAVVEKRLYEPDLPRPSAQRIADLLGIKLRPVPR